MLGTKCFHSSRLALRQQLRSFSDLTVLPETRKPVISYGPSGRSAVSGHVATVFGATGFLGRYVVSKLAKAGTQVVIPYRDEDEQRHLKVAGDLGQVVKLEWDLRNEEQISECVRHSDIVYNLVGRNYETKNFKLDDVHVAGAARIAAISRRNGVSRFIHVSHLNASSDSSSAFFRSKAAGEAAVLEAFPEATIFRPAGIYGFEDKFLSNMATYPWLWKFRDGETVARPLHSLDLAQAFSNMTHLSLPGATLNLPGPRAYTHNDLHELIAALTYNEPYDGLVPPKSLLVFASRLAQSVWWPIVSPDEIERRQIDDVDTGLSDWDLVGVTPEHLENVAITYLRRFRNSTNYARPVVLPVREGGTSGYHVSK